MRVTQALVPYRTTNVSDTGGCDNRILVGYRMAAFALCLEIGARRSYLSQQELIEFAAAHSQHMQKALMGMNPRFEPVSFHNTGATGRRTPQAIVAGSEIRKCWRGNVAEGRRDNRIIEAVARSHRAA